MSLQQGRRSMSIPPMRASEHQPRFARSKRMTGNMGSLDETHFDRKLTFTIEDIGVQHSEPFHSSGAPGIKSLQNNAVRRRWHVDAPRLGRWDRAAKIAHYAARDATILQQQSHNEKFASRLPSTRFAHTHVDDGGLSATAEDTELRPERLTGRHIRTGLYRGKWEDNAKPRQMILTRQRRALAEDGDDAQSTASSPNLVTEEGYARDGRPEVELTHRRSNFKRGEEMLEGEARRNYATLRQGETDTLALLGLHFTAR